MSHLDWLQPQLLCFLGCLCLPAWLPSQVTYGTLEYRVSNERKDSETDRDDPQVAAALEMIQQLLAEGAFDKNYLATFTPDAFTYVEVQQEDPTIEKNGEKLTILCNIQPQRWYTNTTESTCQANENA